MSKSNNYNNNHVLKKVDKALYVDVTIKELLKGKVRKFIFGAGIEIEKDAKFKNNEELIGMWFVETFGGKLLVLKENDKDGNKTADFLWNDKTNVEVKESVGSDSSINDHIRKGRKQVKDGIIILDITKSKNNINNVLKIVRLKMKTYKANNVVVIRNGKIVVYYKKSNRC
jgi:hypothetical protein